MYLRYGTGVWWTYDSFAEQVEAMMDCYEILFPEFQICSEVDHNHGHAKKKVGALCVTDMNLNWGGKKDPIRPGEGSLMTNDCVGNQPRLPRLCWHCSTLRFPRASARCSAPSTSLVPARCPAI